MTNAITVLALGFFLGMRHATDADHVIAVATIVSRERSSRAAAVIGAAWGLGHTLTILVVGGAIILLGWVIPPRVGMSMEMAVGFMLCLLGLANLRGITGWLRETVDAARNGSTHHVHSHAHRHGGPAVGAGEHAFHSRLEWVSRQDMEKAVQTIVHLAMIWEEKA